DHARGKARQAVSLEHCDRRPLRLRNARLSGLELRGQLRRPETVLAALLRPVALDLLDVQDPLALAREPVDHADVADRVLDAGPVLTRHEGLTLDALERDDDFAVVLALFRNIHRPMLEPWPAREPEDVVIDERHCRLERGEAVLGAVDVISEEPDASGLSSRIEVEPVRSGSRGDLLDRIWTGWRPSLPTTK